MTSLKKIEANRRNARKSTGPKSAQGKTRSSRNSRRLGLYSRYRPWDGEDTEDYDAIFDEVNAELEPVGPFEHIIADQVVGIIWRLRRLEGIEHTVLGELRVAELRKIEQTCPERDLPLFNRIVDEGIPDHRSQVRDQLAMRSRMGVETESDILTSDLLKLRISCAFDIDLILAQGYILSEAAPLEKVERVRRTLTRDLLRNLADLDALRSRRSRLKPEPQRSPHNESSSPSDDKLISPNPRDSKTGLE